MIDAIRLWVRAELRQGWRSLLFVGLLCALVVGVVLGLVAGARRAGSAVDRFATATELPDVTVFVGQEPPAELLAALDDDDRVVSVARGDVALVAAGSPPGPGLQTLISDGDGERNAFGRVLVVEGRLPAPGATDEVIVNVTGARRQRLTVGDRLPIISLPCFDPTCQPTTLGEAELVGVIRLPFDLVVSDDTSAIFAAGPDLVGGRWREAAIPGTILFLRLADGVDLDAYVDELSTEVGGLGDVLSSRADVATADRAADLQSRALWIAAGVAALAGAAAIGLTSSRHLQRRTNDAVVLSALGVDRPTRLIAAGLTLAPAIVGGLLAAVVVAVAVSPLFPLGAISDADPDPGVRIDAVALLLGVLVALIVAGVLALLAALRWATITEPSRSTSRSWLAAIGSGLRLRPEATTGASFALDPGRGPARLPVLPTLAVVTATVGVAVGAIVVFASLDRLLDTPTQFGQPWALNVGLEPSSADDPSGPVQALAADERVEALDLLRYGEVDVAVPGRAVTQLSAIGIDGIDGPTNVVLMAGRRPAGQNEVAVGRDTMEALGIAIGERVDISGPNGEQTVEVVGQAILPLFGFGDSGRGMVMPLDTFAAVGADQLAAEIDRIEGAAVVLRDDEDADALSAELVAQDVFVDGRVVPPDVSSLRGVRAVPLLVVAVVVSFGVVALGHALVLAVRRRRRDLAVLRALGQRPGQARATVRWQAITISVVAVALGVPIGVVLGRTIWVAIAEPSNVITDPLVPVLALVVVVAVVAVVALALAAIPGQRAASLRPAQILRSE